MLGNRAFSTHHEQRIPLYLTNNILGGPGMNARLNIALRERRGLVYTVESNMVTYADTGVWCVYFGCDPHDVKRCLRLVRSELNKLMDKPYRIYSYVQQKNKLKDKSEWLVITVKALP